MRTVVSIAALAAFMVIASGQLASAQTQQQCLALGYAGDYDAATRCMEQVMRRTNQQMQDVQWQMVHSEMRNPDCWRAYHDMGMDRRVSYEEFTYEWLATGHFSPEGIARFRQNESANRQREMAAVRDLRAAEMQRGEAQTGYWDDYFRNQSNAGLGLQGRGPYVDPYTGDTLPLDNTHPGHVTVGADGTQYVMDERGNYYARRPGGDWVPMRAGR